ncbi:MAG: Piwi domain protein [Firmicutes bacterium ADurb.Bin193]|nr:MAG: Piwi domain protein [Firmicutes bacterium ADurb.Bin193]
MNEDNIMLNYVELSNSEFGFTVYRKAYDASSKDDGFYEYRLPTIDHSDSDDYAVSFEEKEDCLSFLCSSYDNINLTKKWLINELIKKMRTGCVSSEYFVGTHFIPNISFVISKHKAGNCLIRLEPYYLDYNNSFGFIIDYKFQPNKGFEKSREEKILSLSIDQYGNKNKNFYADKYKYISSFVKEIMTKIFPIDLGENTIDITKALSEIKPFILNEKKYIFQNGEHNVQFQGIKELKPFVSISKEPLFIFVFEKSKINTSRQLVKALRGELYSTFSGMEKMFGVRFANENIKSIIVDDFSKKNLDIIETELNEIIKRNSDKQMVGIFAGIAKDFDASNDYSPYYLIKSYFLKNGLAVQAVTIEQAQKKDGFKWSISGIGLQLFVKLGGQPWKVKPCNNDCVIFGISSAHIKDNDGNITKYFAYSLCFDSSGIYRRLNILGESNDRDTYIAQLSEQIKLHLNNEMTTNIKKCVIHIPFKMNKYEIRCIKDSIYSVKQAHDQIEFVFIKINVINRFFGYSHYNSCIPLAGTCIPLGKREFLVWFEGIQQGKTQVIASQNITNPVHIQFMDSGNLNDDDIKSYLQDIVNLSGANWRGFNAKHEPVTTLYPELIARFAGKFVQYGISLDIGDTAMDKVWFI